MLSRSLTELRLLGSARFDSECLLTTILCGGPQLPERFREQELSPLGSRIRTRWIVEPWDNNALKGFLDHALDAAGATQLMTDGLKATLVEHAAGNLRVLCGMGEDLLRAAAERDLKRLDEKLYLELYAQPSRDTSSRRRRRTT
jgi:type II secretory pathway predicted ATPase ExeA